MLHAWQLPQEIESEVVQWYNKCDKIREKLGLGDFMFYDLRENSGSVLAQNGVSTAVTRKSLAHSYSDLTNKVYTNVDPVLYHAVDKIPVNN